MSNTQWHEDQGVGEKALRDHARLVQAAPTLLRALEAVSKWCHQGHGNFPASQCGLCKPVFEALAEARKEK